MEYGSWFGAKQGTNQLYNPLQNLISKMTAPAVPVAATGSGGQLAPVTPGTYRPSAPAAPSVGVSPVTNPGPNLGGALTTQNPFSSIETGESAQLGAALAPLTSMNTFLSNRLGEYNGLDLSTAIQQMLGLSGQMYDTMGVSPEGQAASVANYANLMQPQIAEQRSQLANSLTSMGMGGGRLARAMAGFGRDVNSQIGTYAQQKNDAADQLRQQIGQMLYGSGEQNYNQKFADRANLTTQLGGLASEMSGVPRSIWQMFKTNPNQGG
jgi:hypothetical protein